MVERTVKLSALVSVDELSKLQRIAEGDGVPIAQVVRRLIRSEYQKRHGTEKPRVTPPTMRGLLDDVTGRAHLTAGNIAERMGIPLDDVVKGLKALERKGVLEHVGTFGTGMQHSTWSRSRHVGTKNVYEMAEAAKLDLDDPLFEEEE